MQQNSQVVAIHLSEVSSVRERQRIFIKASCNFPSMPRFLYDYSRNSIDKHIKLGLTSGFR
jgi:hypothetical protein